MAESEKIFSSKMKYGGLLQFADFYKFCYDWLEEEFGLSMTEDAYIEKISGDTKNIDIEWSGSRKITDYFQFKVSVKFKIIALKKVEVEVNGVKQKMNDASVEVKVNSTLVRDYQGKFEENGLQKFLRSIYEKWIIGGRIDQMEDKLVGDSNDFLEQAKSYLALEGKR